MSYGLAGCLEPARATNKLHLSRQQIESPGLESRGFEFFRFWVEVKVRVRVRVRIRIWVEVRFRIRVRVLGLGFELRLEPE